MKDTQLNVRIPTKLRKEARIKAISDGVLLSDVVRDLLAGWVDGTITLPQPEPPTKVKPDRSKT